MRNRYDICEPKFFFEPLSNANIERLWKIKKKWWEKLLILLLTFFYYPICIGMFTLYYLTLPLALLNDKLGGI